MLDKSISGLIKSINNIDSFLEKQAQIKPDVGKAGGRFFSVKVAGKPVEFKMKELIADIHGTVVKESKDPTKAIDPKKVSNILKNLKELDNRGYKEVKTHSLIIRLMTTLRQILGNLGFNKKGMLKDLQTLSNKKVRFSNKTDEIPSTPTLKKKEEVKTKSKQTIQEPATGKSLKLNLPKELKEAGPATWAKGPVGSQEKQPINEIREALSNAGIRKKALGKAGAEHEENWEDEKKLSRTNPFANKKDIVGDQEVWLKATLPKENPASRKGIKGAAGRRSPTKSSIKTKKALEETAKDQKMMVIDNPLEVPADSMRTPMSVLEAAEQRKMTKQAKVLAEQQQKMTEQATELAEEVGKLYKFQATIFKGVDFIGKLPTKDVSLENQLENLKKLKLGLNQIQAELADRKIKLPYQAAFKIEDMKVMVNHMLADKFNAKNITIEGTDVLKDIKDFFGI